MATHEVHQENETETKRAQVDNHTNLEDDVDNIKKWKDILEKTLADTNYEIKDLSNTKDQLEYALEAKNLPTEVNIENLVTREQHRDIDVIEDEVEEHLHQEQKVIEGIKKQLQQKIDESFEELCLLQEAQQQILANLQDMNVALGIDVDQYNLTEKVPGFSYKSGTFHVPQGSTNPQSLEDLSHYNKDHAEAEMAASKVLQKASHDTLQQTDDDLEAKTTATNFAFHKNMQEIKRILNELKNQKEQTEQEICELQNEIQHLNDEIRAKVKPLKLAQTRLKNQTNQSKVEPSHEDSQYSIDNEVHQLEQSKLALEKKLQQSQHNLNGLKKNLYRIKKDIQYTTNSLMLDEECMKSRDKLVGEPSTQSQHNPSRTVRPTSPEELAIPAPPAASSTGKHFGCQGNITGCYSKVMTRWPHFVTCAIILLSIGCALLAIFVIPFPDFDTPLVGFEVRGSKIKGQEQVILKLAMPEKNGLSFIAPSPFKEEVISSPYVRQTYINFIKSALNRTEGRHLPSKKHKVTTVHNPQEEDLEGCNDISFNVTVPKIIFTSKAGETLLTEQSIKAMCSLEKKFTSSLEPKSCPHRQSITYYMEGMFGKHCEGLSSHDIKAFLDILQLCMPYYESGQLKEICDNYNCINIPVECRVNKTIFNIIHFLSDNQFFYRDTNQVKYKEKLTYAMLAVTNVRDYRSYYHEYIKDAALSEGNVFVKAIDSRVKLVVFADFLLEEIMLFAVAMGLVLLLIYLYVHSFIITLATVLNVVFTLLISYSIYHIVLNFNHFPFLNILAGLVCISISADDVFLFYDTWQRMKSEYPEATLPQWMSKTLRHAALSICVTSLTTAAGFFSNVVSEITDIRCFGIFSGVAILCNLALMIIWIPSVVVLLEKYGQKCCSKNCKCFEKIRNYLSKINVIFEQFLPSVVNNTWFVWLILLFLLGVGGIFVVFGMPRLELPDSAEVQVFQVSDPIEVWDMETKTQFRYSEKNMDDVTKQKLPVTIVWGLKGSDNGNLLDPSDSGSLEFDRNFNMSSPKAQTWMEGICHDVKNSSWIDPSMKHVPCTISVFNEMMKLPCVHEGLSPCCGHMSLPPFPEDIFSECLPKITSAIQFMRQNPSGEIQDFISLGTPVYSKKESNNGLMIGYVLTATGNKRLSPFFGQMERYLNELESFLSESGRNAPHGVENSWITSGFKFYDLQRALSSGTYIALGVQVAVAFLVMLITTLNMVITIYAIFTITMSLSVTIGALVLLGWKLNIVESVIISLAVGLSIDFTIHYGVAYRLSKSTERKEKVSETFLRVGPSVAMAAFTTFITGAAIMPATILAYTRLGIFLMLVMSISWTYATFFFQSLCRILGPKKTAHLFGCCQCKTEERVPNDLDLN